MRANKKLSFFKFSIIEKNFTGLVYRTIKQVFKLNKTNYNNNDIHSYYSMYTLYLILFNLMTICAHELMG